MPLLRARFALLVAVTLAAPALTVACSNQAEGERCDRNNEDEDCQEGLICKSSQELGGSADICCPKEEGASEIAACIRGGGATAVASTGSGATATSTTTSDASSSVSSGGGAGQGGDTGAGGEGTGGAPTGGAGGAGGGTGGTGG
jgi:hypothetical protein